MIFAGSLLAVVASAVVAAEVYQDPKAWALLVVAVAVLIVAWSMRRSMANVTAELGNIKVTATTIEAQTKQTVDAVNHVAADEPPLIQRVIQLEESQHWLHDTLTRIADATGVSISPSPLDRRNAP